MQEKKRFDFTVEVEGETYHCYRLVEGTRILTQTIYVLHGGKKFSKQDQGSYGKSTPQRDSHPPDGMEDMAELDAMEIIRIGMENDWTEDESPYRIHAIKVE